MKYFGLAIILSMTFSCSQNPDNSSITEIDNAELQQLFDADQEDRESHKLDTKGINYNDSIREARVYELLDSNKVRTANDYTNAALIFHHGEDSIAYRMAVELMRKSIELDSAGDKWFLAVITDRYLLSINKPQIYGTHYKRLANNIVVREEMDSTKITDAERIEYGVETLAEQREKIKNLNKKKLTELLDEGKTVDELILFVKNDDVQTSQYDLRETWFNHFGYNLMNEGEKDDALKIFKLNTELYPDSYNSFDSYGECLLEFGDIENAIIAYKRSLELNADNNNAKKVLSDLKK